MITVDAVFSSLRAENQAIREEFTRIKKAQNRPPMDAEEIQKALQRVRESYTRPPIEEFAAAFVREIERHHGII